MKSNVTKIELTAYDDLFETDQSREEIKLAKIHEIPIELIDEFPNHPFHVIDDNEDMQHLIDSIKERGLITPATVRSKADGRFELISGHRRKRACELAGLITLKTEIKELTHEEATILMVDSNLQRTSILPSEKAFSYKMRLDAMNKQGQRTDLTSTPVESKLRTNETLSKFVGESREQIRRYIRLTYLIPDLLALVDQKKIAFRPAVELSYLSESQQTYLYESIQYHDATPSLAQAIQLRDFSKRNALSNEIIDYMMGTEKPNQKTKIRLDERVTTLIPKSVPTGKETDYIVKALEHYNRIQARNQRER